MGYFNTKHSCAGASCQYNECAERLKNYYNKDETDKLLDGKQDKLNPHQMDVLNGDRFNANNYYNKTEADARFQPKGDYALKSDIPTDVDDYIEKAHTLGVNHVVGDLAGDAINHGYKTVEGKTSWVLDHQASATDGMFYMNDDQVGLRAESGTEWVRARTGAFGGGQMGNYFSMGKKDNSSNTSVQQYDAGGASEITSAGSVETEIYATSPGHHETGISVGDKGIWFVYSNTGDTRTNPTAKVILDEQGIKKLKHLLDTTPNQP